MVWEFKREIYCTRERKSKASCDNLSDPALRRRIQTYLNEQPGFPAEDSEEEYSFYFEATYPHESDRRRYIENAVRRGTATYGHVVLALLMKAGKINAGFGTNFDPLLEDSWAKVNGSVSGLTVAHTGEPEKAFQAISEARYPLYAKLHGDFQSRKLKNIATELAKQDARLRHALVQYCRNNGLVVCGYSGRDASIMEALDDAIDEGQGYPNGLFWTYKAGTTPSDAVVRLIDVAACAGVQAALVEIDSFDDLMAGLAGVLPGSAPQAAIDAAGARPSRLSAPDPPQASGQAPFVRTNALALLRMPSTCRLIGKKAGSTKEIRESLKEAGANALAARTSAGVIAFGSDAELAKVFGSGASDLYTLKPEMIVREGSQKGLLHDALALALASVLPVEVRRRHRDPLLILRDDAGAHESLKKLKVACGGTLEGTVGGVRWAEALRFKIDRRLDRFWLVMEPTVWAERPKDPKADDARKEFIRRREAARYNRQWYSVLNGWIAALFGEDLRRTFGAFGTGDGVDAVFEIGRTSGFSGARH